MTDPSIPPFELPEWGEEGAPPAPRLYEEEEQQERGAPPGRSRLSISTLAGTGEGAAELLTGAGEARVGDGTLGEAAAVAVAAAIEALEARAREAGAGRVEGVRLSTALRKGRVVVIAYGTRITGP